ncbi:uncharacterized protein LOC9655028 [Selaginella moellendorffii]|uniref:uncharacterized protein LOC9655028 n=1 Tax=Selaginella moellendorffii TaxID=88036 RepID=UPI000D1CE261|nr:uncharacterized protein LOC9655028 [Selaginella moellendorffii]|eukprot:XP_024525240.1 uncharacterized protein LOC9655028 [Selaginella moellendorffii]
MEPLTAVPKLYTIESTACLGYCITQQGTQIVLKFKDALNPFQLWYRDESWQFLSEDNSDLSALVFINHGSKKALRSQSSGALPSLLLEIMIRQSRTILSSGLFPEARTIKSSSQRLGIRPCF